MHEYGVTQTLLKALLDQLRCEHISQVSSVTFRRSSAFSEDVLRQTFDALSRGTPLEGAALIVEVTQLIIRCDDCGLIHEVKSDDLFGHVFVCPDCGSMTEVAEAHDLELTKVVVNVDPVDDG